ncbi:hypothetical protein [Ferruginibacter sp.]
MRKLHWFTTTNIACKDETEFEFDLTPFIPTFKKSRLWEKTPYRTEYREKFSQADFDKIKSVKFYVHTDRTPFTNLHGYESILKQYINLSKIEKNKIFVSGISEAQKIIVIETEFDSDKILNSNLKYKDEKDVEKVMATLSNEHYESWDELKRIKSILCEFAQFFIFNLHLNFLTHQYTHSIKDKAELIGFTVTSENKNQYFEVEKIDLLSHYILYERNNDNMNNLMGTTSQFWCNDISSIHFFLDALKGNYVTSTNFIKLVFTIESFFGDNISNDYITLTIPLLISDNISDMKSTREIIRTCFTLRNKIVHGNTAIDFMEHSRKKKSESSDKPGMDELFFELKNILIKIFYFYIRKKIYLDKKGNKINHELLFSLLPNGVS